jgi:phage FluMu protein Com
MDKRHTTHIQHGLDFLEKENYLTKEEINGIVFYSIKEGNKSLAIVRIMCPKCKTVRNIYNPNQVVAACANPDCMTKDRKRRHIEIRRKKIVYDMSKFLHVYNG